MVSNINDSNVSPPTRLLWIIYIILQQFVAIIIARAIAIMFDGYLDELWLWHKILTPTGVVIIMFEGILAFSPYNHLTSNIKKTNINKIHGILMAFGLTLMTIGVSFAYATNDEHFTTTHGIFGLIAWILCLVTASGGIILSYLSQLIRDQIRPIYIRFAHTFLGLTSFIISMITCALGFHKFYDSQKVEITVIIVLIALVSFAVFIRSGLTVLKHTRTVFAS